MLYKIITLLALVFFATPAWGAYPVVASVGHSTEASPVTTHDAVTAAGISAGNLLMMKIILRNVSDTDPLVSGAISGWTAITGCAVDSGDPTVSVYGIWYYKFASGGETNFTYNSTASVLSVTRMLRITGAHASTPPECVAQGYIGDVANSGSLTASWGAEDNLFITATGKYNPTDQCTVFPTNYTDNQYNGYFGTSDAELNCMATRNLSSATDDPGAFTFGGAAGNGVDFTLVVRPASAAAAARKVTVTVVE